MPIYEYKCQECKRSFTVLCSLELRDASHNCDHCRSEKTSRMVSRFKTIRTEEQILESMTDPSMLSGIDEQDPRSIARWAKKMAREMGEDMGDEIEAMAEEETTSGL